jgi:alpha/beta superfamily hydrolase
MSNKVVTTVAKAFNRMGIVALRFNYRGVERSEGQYGDVVGEVADCMAVVNWAQQEWPHAKLWFAGFSFGAFIAASAAAKTAAEQLISIAPAVDRMPYATLTSVNCPWLVIQGEDDEVVIPESVYSWFSQLNANKTLIKFADTGHFFHGKLIELQSIIENLQTNY